MNGGEACFLSFEMFLRGKKSKFYLAHFLSLNSNNGRLISEKLHVEHSDGPVQSAHRGRVRRALQGHLRVRLRLLENGHFSVSRRRVSFFPQQLADNQGPDLVEPHVDAHVNHLPTTALANTL